MLSIIHAMPKGQFLAKTLAKTSLNPSLCLQALCVCVLHSRRDSFPETAGTKQVTVTLEENHRVQESIWQNACVCVCESWIIFSVSDEGFEHAPTAPPRPLSLWASQSWHENNGMICTYSTIFHLSFSGDRDLRDKHGRMFL